MPVISNKFLAREDEDKLPNLPVPDYREAMEKYLKNMRDVLESNSVLNPDNQILTEFEKNMEKFLRVESDSSV